MTKTRSFHIGDVLSITTGFLVSPRRMEGVYDILNFLTADDLFTHQLPRAAKECRPSILEQFPQLRGVDASGLNVQSVPAFLKRQVSLFGEYLMVRRMSSDRHQRIDPIQEAEQLIGKDRVIVVEKRD